MCICINCKHLNNCRTYHFIEVQHKLKLKRKKYWEESYNFIPVNTLIQINLKQTSQSNLLDWDLIECLSFVENPGAWLIK
uniref:Ycf34 n=1 Tax=Antithamnionella ternifolia TaxID=207919 RepID=A0A4D6WNK9_9FLOR|nr:hypothetical protein [Antithamnionella ternifolia]